MRARCEALAEAQPAAVERIDVPTLLVTGDEDGVAPPQRCARMAERIQRRRVVVLPRCGHWTTVESAARSRSCQSQLRSSFLPSQLAWR